MRLILNVIWLIFGGLVMALGYVLAAIICFILIITIPFGFAALRIAAYALWPFGRTIVDKPGDRPFTLVGNIIWCVLCGIWLAIGHVLWALGCFVTIIGIPFGIQHLKLTGIALAPIGKTIVSNEVAAAARAAAATPGALTYRTGWSI